MTEAAGTTFYHWSDGSAAAYTNGRRAFHPRVEHMGRDVPAGGTTMNDELMNAARTIPARFVLFNGTPEKYTRHEVTRARWLEAVSVRRAA